MLLTLRLIFKYYRKTYSSWFSSDLTIPVLTSVAVSFITINDPTVFNTESYSVLVSVCGILAAFAITSLVYLTSSDNDTIRTAKTQTKNDKIVSGYPFTKFRQIFVLNTYAATLAFVVLLLFTIFYLFPFRESVTGTFAVIHDFICTFLILHLIMINIRISTKIFLLFFNDTRLKVQNKIYDQPYAKSKEQKK